MSPQDADSLSEFTVEYGCALLMNLCLRSAGRSAVCSGGSEGQAAGGGSGVSVASLLMRLCESLIESKNDQVRTYIHGILYSVLERPSMREEAQSRGMVELLQAVAANSTELFASQLNCILARVRRGICRN